MTPDERREEWLKEMREMKEFHAEIEAYEREHFDPVREDAEDAEHQKLVAQYAPGFVAYSDTWDGRTLTRQVLAHAPTHGQLSKLLDHMTEDELETMQVVYLDPPNQSLCTRAVTGEIRATVSPRE